MSLASLPPLATPLPPLAASPILSAPHHHASSDGGNGGGNGVLGAATAIVDGSSELSVLPAPPLLADVSDSSFATTATAALPSALPAYTNNDTTTNNNNNNNALLLKKLPAFLTIPASNAVKLTLKPDDCHRLGTFPYFTENISGMFIRLRMDRSSEKHIWARIVCAVTADGLAEKGLIAAIGGGGDLSGTSSGGGGGFGGGSFNNNNNMGHRLGGGEALSYTLLSQKDEQSALRAIAAAAGGATSSGHHHHHHHHSHHHHSHLSSTTTTTAIASATPSSSAALALSLLAEANAWSQLPALWRNRLVEEPTYEWREKRFEVHLICEHPFAATVNTAFVREEEEDEDGDEKGEENNKEGTDDEDGEEEADLEDAEKEAGVEGEDLSEGGAKKKNKKKSNNNNKKKNKKEAAPPSQYFLATFRQLGKEQQPTQEEVDNYCVQFVPIAPNATSSAKKGGAVDPKSTNLFATATGAVSSSSASAAANNNNNSADANNNNNNLSYVPSGFAEAFLRLPAQTEAEAALEALEARIQERVGKSSSMKRDRNGDNKLAAAATQTHSTDDAYSSPSASSSAASALPHAGRAAVAAAKWSKFFEKSVIHRALSKEDAAKVVAANTRLNNVAGNAVIRGAVLYNLNLSRASQLATVQRLEEKAASQSLKAVQKALSRQALIETSIRRAVEKENKEGDSNDYDEDANDGTSAFPQATQMGGPASSQEMGGEGEEPSAFAFSSPDLLAASSVGGGGARRSISFTTATATAESHGLDVEALIKTALGPTATPHQIAEIKKSLLASSSSGLSPHLALANGLPPPNSSSSSLPRAGSNASSVAPAHGNNNSSANTNSLLAVLLTSEELSALQRDDAQFNTYVRTEGRARELDRLAAITQRNAAANIALRLRGYQLMAVRDEEYEAHDDTMQPMWHTDGDMRRKEAAAYAEEKGKGDDGAKGGEGKKGQDKRRGAGLTEAEELALYASEARRVNEIALSRIGSTASGGGEGRPSSQSSSPSAASSSSLLREVSSVTAAPVAIAAADDLDDLLSLAGRVSAQCAAEKVSASVASAQPSLVRDVSILSPSEKVSVSQSLGRIPLVSTGGKRGRE